MLVEEMNILTTIFLRYDNQMIYYPNSILATKPITNLNRSPPLGDSVEFSVDFSTSVASIAALKAKIKGYVWFYLICLFYSERNENCIQLPSNFFLNFFEDFLSYFPFPYLI